MEFVDNPDNLDISIHAPVKGATFPELTEKNFNPIFQSTHP